VVLAGRFEWDWLIGRVVFCVLCLGWICSLKILGGGWLLFPFIFSLISSLLPSCHLFSYPFISFGYVPFLPFCLFGH
jgi:hypothetical protein